MTHVFDSYGPSGASAAVVTAVDVGPFWTPDPAAPSDFAAATPPVPPVATAASGPLIIQRPDGGGRRSGGTGAGISAAIPSVSNARLALDRATTERAVADRATHDKTPSYREQYADTQFAAEAALPAGTPPAPPSGPLTAAENEPPWRRIGCLRAITLILGLNWLVPGVIGLVADGIVIRGSGPPFGDSFPPDFMARLQAIVTVIGLVHLAWIGIGVKILLAPGRWSLALTGVCLFVGAIAILYGLSLVRAPAPGAIAVVGVFVLLEVVLGLMAITAAQSID